MLERAGQVPTGDRPRIAVVGSLVMDLIFRVARPPAAGETIFGESFQQCPGGKGFNQAIAAHRCGAQVLFMGRIGADVFGAAFRELLDAEGITTDSLLVDPQVGTGVACPIVDAEGRNSIVVVPRANLRLDATDVEQARLGLEQAQVLLLQHEIPPKTSAAAARIARGSGRTVILNPAPAVPLDPELLEHVDILVPNEAEALAYAGNSSDLDDPVEAARRLHERFGRTVILTRSDEGAAIVDCDSVRHVPAFPVACVDSTGAGDAFCGALAVGLAEGMSLDVAVRFACAAGAVAVTRHGTSAAMPYRPEVEAMLAGA